MRRLAEANGTAQTLICMTTISIREILPMPIQQNPFPELHLSLTCLSCSNLIRRTLCPHLRLNPSRLSSSCTHRTLRFFHLLLALCCRLLLLALFYGGLSGCSTSFWALGATLFDDVERGANNTTLLLYRAAGTFFGNFLKKE